MSESSQLSGIYRFAVATSIATIVLLMAGALVTNNDAGDSVPDWPLAYHRLIPSFTGGVRYEYSHRVIAGLVAIMTAILAIWIAASDKRRSIRRLGWSALALVLAQAVLGGMRVLIGDPALYATSHAVLAQIVFIAVVSLSLFISPWWRHNAPRLEDTGSPRALTIASWTTLIIFIQIVLGAAFRHGALGIVPHVVGAVVVGVFVVWTGRVIRKRFPTVPELRRGVAWLHSTFGTQVLLGIAAYWVIAAADSVGQPSQLYVVLTVAHVLVGALTLASSLLLTLSCSRMILPSHPATSTSPAVSSSAANSPGKAGA